MTLEELAARYGFLVRVSARTPPTPDRFWLIDAQSGRIASPRHGETFEQIEPAIRPAGDRRGTSAPI